MDPALWWPIGMGTLSVLVWVGAKVYCWVRKICDHCWCSLRECRCDWTMEYY
jgi:hypothetical protein